MTFTPLWCMTFTPLFTPLCMVSSGQFCNLAPYMLCGTPGPDPMLCSEQQLIVVTQVTSPVASKIWLRLPYT